MKKLFCTVILISFFSILFISCKKNENPVSTNGGTTNTVNWRKFIRNGINKRIDPNTFTYDTVNADVPSDNILSGYTANITLTLDSIEAVDVRNLKFVLIHRGTGVLAIDSLTKNGTGFIGTSLSDSGTVPIDQSASPYTGLFKPQRSFAIFKSIPPEGPYILRVFNSGSNKTGVIKSWGITVTYNSTLINNCLNFDGTSSYVSVPDGSAINSILTNNTFTLEGWYRINGYSSNYFSFLDKKNSWYCEYSRIDTAWTLVAPGVGTVKSIKYPVALNTWHHIAVTYDGLNDITKFYADGNFLSQSNGVLSFTQRPDSLYIAYGISGAPEFGRGSMDEIRIWNLVRSQSEIASSYNMTLTGSESGLVLYYKFSEGIGNITSDATTNNITGTLVNNPVWILDGPNITP
jgi:hypothetical protein